MGLLSTPYDSYQIFKYEVSWFKDFDGRTDKHTYTHAHTCVCMHTAAAAAWSSHGPHGIHCPTLFSWDENYAKNGITHLLRSFLNTS